MQCNIDRRGRTVRLVGGMVLELLGFGFIAIGAMELVEGIWPFVLGVALFLSGGFVMVEAMIGWCALRAMGFKTPV